MFVRRPQSRGFTLTEILCVVVILGIASAIILPQLSTRADLKAGAAARVVMADLMFAQNRAISRQTTQYVQFDTTTRTYKLLDGSPMVTLTHPVTLNPYVVTFGSGGSNGLEDVSLTAVNFDASSTLAFDELGAPYSYDSVTGLTPMSAGSIQVSCDGYVLTITVEPSTGELTVNTP